MQAASDGKGRGATFTVTLPALSAPAVPVDDAVRDRTAATLHGVKVLVVDDDLDTCDIVGAVLESAGAEVRTCLSARAALTVMDAWAPDILVSDIAMPGDDGYALIRTIRARKADQGGRIVAVALTAYARQEDRAKALSAGFQVHVGKPVEPLQLVRIVASAGGYESGTRH
jgi:hypothetical protein